MGGVLFAFDCDSAVGTGHRARCATLATALKHQNVSVCFLQNPHLKEILGRKAGHDWVVLDSYRFDHSWERQCRAAGLRVLTIDDSPKRLYECDVLLDPNLSATGSVRWARQVSSFTQVLSGAAYLLLREEFLAAPPRIRTGTPPDQPLILVSLGGADEPGLAQRVMEALSSDLLKHRARVTLVAGDVNPHADLLASLCRAHPQAAFVRSTSEMAKLMGEADLCVGAGGSSLWERAYLGLPSLVATLARNQEEAVEYLAGAGALWPLGWHEELTVKVLEDEILRALDQPQRLAKQAKTARELVGEPCFIRDPLRVFSSVRR